MKNKTFDCVEMKRRGAQRIHDATANMRLEEKVEYWKHRNALFRREQEALVHDKRTAAGGVEDVIDAELEEKS